MEDIGKALIMSAQILMFVFAATISIYLYSVLTNSINEIMLASDYSNRGDAIFGSSETSNSRDVTKAEIILAILDLKDKYTKLYDNTYEVRVNGTTYTYDPSFDPSDPDKDAIKINGVPIEFDSFELHNKLENEIDDVLYKLSYDASSKILIYKEK